MDNPVVIFIVITIIISIILYAILGGNKTGRLYKKGIKAFKNNNLDMAEKYFNVIINEHPDASKKIEEIIFKRGEIAQVSGDPDTAYNYFSQIKSRKAHEKLIEIDLERGLIAKKKDDLGAAYQFFSKISEKSPIAKKEAALIDFKRGVIAEGSKKLNIAKDYYSKSLPIQNINQKLHDLAFCRILICNIKQEQQPQEDDIEFFTNSDIEEHFFTDLVFRYTILLIKNAKYEKAQYIIDIYLDKNLLEIKNLISIINKLKKVVIRNILTNINSILSQKDRSNTQTLEKIYNEIEINENILKEFPEYLNKMKAVLPFPVFSPDIFIKEIKRHIFGKLLNEYLNEKQFKKGIELITHYPNFFEYPELLKNAGLCCIKLALDNKINEDNYQTIIPLWLTAIYSDDVFLKSLERTVWDDEHTFTLNDSVGRYSKYLFDINVENVNRDEVTETNISIGEAQKDLIGLFEKSLNQIEPEKLNNEIQNFYSEEKEVIEKLTKMMPYDVPLATPTFAKQFGIDKTILKHLNWIYEKKQKEEVLDLGEKYFRLKLREDKSGVILQSDATFEKYASSKWYADLGISRIKSKNVGHLEPNVYKDVINRFEKIKVYFEKEVIHLLNKYIQEESEGVRLINLIENLTQILPSSESIKYIYSDYVTNYCIQKINKSELDPTSALDYLIKAIVIYPENHRTARNIVLLIKYNLREETFSAKVKEVVPSLRGIESESFRHFFLTELTELKNELKTWLKLPNVNYYLIHKSIKDIEDLIESADPLFYLKKHKEKDDNKKGLSLFGD